MLAESAMVGIPVMLFANPVTVPFYAIFLNIRTSFYMGALSLKKLLGRRRRVTRILLSPDALGQLGCVLRL